MTGPRRLQHPSLLALLPMLLISLIGAPAMAIEEPEYQVVRREADFELRRYAPFLVAETEVAGGFDQVGNRAFRILAGYIFGDNRGRQKIEMTAPVSQRPVAASGERIAMTAPVTQRAADGDGRFVVSFVMPADYRLDTLPEPTDARVTLREQPGRLMAARRYSGRWTESRYRAQEARLLAALGAAGIKRIGTPVYARYNSPFSLWPNRRNEVLVEVAEPGAGQ